jgi:hypothetical protein
LRGVYCVHHQGDIYQTARRNIPEDNHLTYESLFTSTTDAHHVQRNFLAWSHTSCTYGSYWIMMVFST